MNAKPWVLIVDDEGDQAANLKEALEGEGYHIVIANDFQSVVTLCGEQKFDMGIVDIKLPDIEGVKLVKKLAELSPWLEYVIITGHASLESAVEAIRHKNIVAYEERPLDIGRLISLVRQATKHKQVEEELQTVRKYLESLINYANALIIVWDHPRGRVTLFNRAFERLTGHRANEVIGREVGMLFPEERRDESLNRIASTLNGTRWESVEIPILCKDGDIRITLWNSANIYAEDSNTLVATIAQGTDITQRKQAEGALRESEEKFRSLFNDALDMIHIIGEDGKIIDANPAELSTLNYTRDEYREKHILEIVHPDYQQVSKKAIKSVFEGKEIKGLETAWITKHGERIDVEVNAVPQTEREKIVSVRAITRDITERKRAEGKKRELEARLQQAQKAETLGTLAGGIAHDFNNLLMSIQGHASLMLLHTDPDHPSFTRLKIIQDTVQLGANLTKQLLGFARGGKYEVKPTDLNELCRQSLRMFGRTQKNIGINEKYQEGIWPVEVDQGQVCSQVLLNIYINAWQAMPGGGHLYIETSNVVLDKDYPMLFGMKLCDYVKISVTDTGVGMDEATRERIFDPFFTTKDMGHGTGLGLASAYGIVKNHGGIIDVDSEKGKGTTFDIYLPASEKVVKIQEKKPADKVLKGTETVLLVDDEHAVLDVARDVLEALGYKTLLARSGKEADEVYGKHKDTIDLVIVDMIMPQMGGGKVYDRIKEINPNVKVLLASGYSVDGQATDILERGCNGFVQKPFSIADLSGKIREILDNK